MSGPGGGRWARGVAFLLLLALSRPLAAQEEGQAGEETEGGFEPVPYTDEEFADWLHDLRRFEIITVGDVQGWLIVGVGWAVCLVAVALPLAAAAARPATGEGLGDGLSG